MGRLRTIENADLPEGMIVRRRPSGAYYYLSSTNGNGRQEIPLGKELENALAEYAALKPHRSQPLIDMPAAAKDLFTRCRKGAKRRGLEFNLRLEDVQRLLEESRGKCSVTGIPFDLGRPDGHRKRLWAPSIDRIASSGGYVAGNVRVVAVAVNLAMSDFGEELLVLIAHGLLRQRRSA